MVALACEGKSHLRVLMGVSLMVTFIGLISGTLPNLAFRLLVTDHPCSGVGKILVP